MRTDSLTSSYVYRQDLVDEFDQVKTFKAEESINAIASSDPIIYNPLVIDDAKYKSFMGGQTILATASELRLRHDEMDPLELSELVIKHFNKNKDDMLVQISLMHVLNPPPSNYWLDQAYTGEN